MGWTKSDLISQAFESVGLASDVFELSAEQQQKALRTLDAMMAEWNGLGIRLGYPVPSNPGASAPNQDSGIPDYANSAVYLSLGIRLAGTVGKPVSSTHLAAAQRGYNSLLSKAAMPPEMQFPTTLPCGAGQKPWRGDNRPFLLEPEDELEAGPDDEITFE